MTYPAISPHPLSGSEPLADTTLLSYWSWAHSNVVDNAERGALAEYLVHRAVGAISPTRVNWDKYDILSPEGIAIEVKASGHIQSWAQERLSAISFSIRPTYGWDADTNTYATTFSRQSDVYVFCLHAHVDQTTINPLDIKQWTFFVLPTSVLNEKCGNQKTISLSRVKELGAIEADYAGLRPTILAAAERNKT